jgi:hypothetical protein
MRRGSRRLPLVEFDAFGAAVGAALVSGGLAVVLPFLAALTGTMVAIAFAAWAVLLRSRGAGARADVLRPRSVLALGCLAVGAAVYLGAPEPIGAFRGLALGVSVVPLWSLERNPPAPAFAVVEPP